MLIVISVKKLSMTQLKLIKNNPNTQLKFASQLTEIKIKHEYL